MAAEQAAAAAPGAATEELVGQDMLSKMLDSMKVSDDAAARTRGMSALDNFVKAITQGQTVSKDAETNIKYWIKEIDSKLTSQVNEILHHEKFQKLEGTWRGMAHLVYNTETSTSLQLKVMNVTFQPCDATVVGHVSILRHARIH